MAGYAACKEEMIKAHRFRSILEDNIKTNLYQIGYKGLGWTGSG